MAQALGVVVDDFLQLGAVLDNRQRLVDLLLPLAHQELGVRVIDDVAHLVHEAVLEQPHPDPSGAQGGHFRHQPLGTVVADHGDLVILLQAELDQPQGDVLDVVQIVLPGDGPPDPELFFPHGHPVFAVLPGFLEKQFGDRQLRGNFRSALRL